MAQEKPIGASTDFGHLTDFEREKRAAAQRAADEDPEVAFQRDMAALEAQKQAMEERRAAYLAGAPAQPAPAPAVPKKFYLLGGKGRDNKIRVVGMYSSEAALAEGIAASINAYAEAGQKLGTIEFDLSIKLDQPPVAPR